MKTTQRFWMVWRDGTMSQVRHPLRDDAMREAARLALLMPGQKLFVLEAIGFSEFPPPKPPPPPKPVWSDLDPEIPF